MDYREYAKDLLRRKNALSSAYKVICGELESLEQERSSCKASMMNNDAESRRYEELLVNILARIEDCRIRRRVVERELMMIEQGMNGLSDYQKDLIESFFVSRHMGVCEELIEKYFRERSGIYRDRNRALEQFTRSVYGVLQL